MSSSSSSSFPNFSLPCPKNGRYDVFLSFRGVDTRYGFTANLYHSLMEHKVHTFMDIKLVGKAIDTLFETIKISKMAVVVYSERFASSDWCLKELDKILQRTKKKKMVMIPIFYKVKVNELKHLTGNTGKYLEDLISKHGETNVQKWKTAVTTLGTISGLSYGDSYEREFILKVIKTVKEMLEEWEEPVGSSIKPGPAMELHNKTELDFIRRFEEMSTILNRLYEKESTGNQQPHVLAKEENTQALGVQTHVLQEDKCSSTREDEAYRIVTSAYFQKPSTQKGLLHGYMCVNSIDPHPTKPWVLLSFSGGFMSIWNYESRAEEKSFKFDDWGTGFAKFIHEKHWIVVGGIEHGFVLVFNYNTSEKVKEFKAHEYSLRCMKVHPTSPYVLTTSTDMLIKLWNWENDWVCSETFEYDSSYVTDVAFNPKDSRSFASAFYDGTIKIWSFGSSFEKFTINAHPEGLSCVEYFVGNDNKLYLLSSSYDYTVRVWDYASKTLVQTLEGRSSVVTKTLVHPKLPIIITASYDKTIRIWNKDTHRLKLVWTSDLGMVCSIGFIQASDEVVLGCAEGMVVIKIVDASGT